MFLPQDFPPRYAALVQTAEIKAGRKFPDLADARERVAAKMDAFAKIALEVAKRGEWSLESVVPGFEHYLRTLCISDLTRFVPDGVLQDRVHELIEEIRHSNRWLSYMRSVERINRKLQTSSAKAESRRDPARRKEFVLRILESKGWSILEWANDAEVAYHTASDYLENRTTPYRSTRLKLAKSLGVNVQDLPM